MNQWEVFSAAEEGLRFKNIELLKELKEAGEDNAIAIFCRVNRIDMEDVERLIANGR